MTQSIQTTDSMVPYLPRHHRAPRSGSISTNPSGSIRAQVSLPSAIGGHAKRLTRSFRTKREAETWIRQMLNEIDSGINAESVEMRFEDFFLRFLSVKRMALTSRTYDDYERIGRLYLLPAFASHSLRQLRLTQINDFYTRLGDQGVSAATIRCVHRLLHTVFNEALKHGILLANPCRFATLPQVIKRRNTYSLSKSQIQEFLERAANHPLSALLQTALMTGMRLGELIGLTWQDIDFEAGILYVQHQIPTRKVKGRARVHEPLKTAAGRRRLKIPERLLTVLHEHHLHQQVQRLLMGSRWRNNDLVFPNSIGNPVQPRTAQRACRDIFQALGLSNLTFHALRHAAASFLLTSGISIADAAGVLGHSNPRITAAVYSHALPDSFEKAAQIFDGLPTIQS